MSNHFILNCLVTSILQFDHLKSNLKLNELSNLMKDYYRITAETINKSNGTIDHFSQEIITSFYGLLARENIPGPRIIEAAADVVDAFQKYKFDP